MEFEEQPYLYRSEVSNESNDNTTNIIFLSQSRFESFGARNPKLRPLMFPSDRALKVNVLKSYVPF